MTVADFLAWSGDGSGRKFQLVDGGLRAMSPGSATHGTIQMTFGRLIGNKLVESAARCRVVSEPAVATRVRANVNLRVPDLGVTCTPDALGQQTLPDPILLIEILSPGNTSDTWDDVWSYTTIPSVREIVVVHSTRVLAELLRRGPHGNWPAEPREIGPDDTFAREHRLCLPLARRLCANASRPSLTMTSPSLGAPTAVPLMAAR
jgi:Uma2 family endonuclease